MLRLSKSIPSKRVLDYGSRAGIFSLSLCKNFKEVYSLEVQIKPIKYLKDRFDLKNLKITKNSCLRLPYKNNFFDAAICFGVFPHINRKEKALRNITSMLKPGGKLVIAHALSSEELKNHHRKASKHVAHSVMPKRSKMKQLLEQKGFVGIRIRDEPGCYLCIAHKPSRA